jgi:3-phenylpropionate/trans-cinnamate dioxygenase ferredoxin reductase subunit
VVGGSFIGLEAAASLRTLGKEVSIVEAADRLLSRVFPPMLSAFLHDAHVANGAMPICGATLKRIGGAGGRVEFVELADGRIIRCDLVLAGIGVLPNTELAQACGLEVDNGIVVDACARTSDPSIVAAGDCARYPNPWAQAEDKGIRLESVQSANDLARVAASAVVGQPKPYHAVPWFWSDQYGFKLQMAGISTGWNRMAVRGKTEDGSFSVFYFRDDRLLGVDSVNQTREHMQARKLLAAGAVISAEQAADGQFDLASLLGANQKSGAR